MNQQELLEYLREHGPMTVPQIADGLKVNVKDEAIYMRMKQLQKYGLVKKTEGHHDTIWEVVA